MKIATFRSLLKPGVQFDRTNREFDAFRGVLRHSGKILWRGSAQRISEVYSDSAAPHPVARKRALECAESALRSAEGSSLATRLQQLVDGHIRELAALRDLENWLNSVDSCD
jgi:hypothetical protein